jgi:hypothetical protein
MGRRKSNSICVTIGEILPLEQCEKLGTLAQRQSKLLSTSAEKALDAKQTEKWAIICCWIGYKRFPIIDIARPPYNNPRFHLWKNLAYTWNAQLNLCQNTFDAAREYPNIFQKIESYGNPLNYWFECMKEYRKAPLPKTLKEQATSQFRKHLLAVKKRQNIPPSEPLTPINTELFNYSIKLSKVKKEVSLSLDEYCHWLGEFIKDFKTQEKLTCHWLDESNLITRSKNNPYPHSLIAPPILQALEKSSNQLSIITKEPWKDQPVYVSATSDFFSGT